MQKIYTTCDICGTVFKEGTAYQSANIKDELGGTFTMEIEVDDGYDGFEKLKHTEYKDYDLCPSCSDKVLEFINELKIKEVQNETMV